MGFCTVLTVKDLHHYQIRAIKKMIQEPELGLFLDIGLGKTTVVLHGLRKLIYTNEIRNALVIAPIRVMYSTWPIEIKKWEYTQNLTYTILHGPNKNGRLLLQRDLYFINYEGLIWLSDRLRKWLRRGKPFPYDAIVFDESSLMKDPKTVRFKKLKGLIGYFKRRYLMTATPIPNSLLDIWSQIYCMTSGKIFGSSYYAFRQKYFYKADYMGYKWAPHDHTKKVIIDSIRDKIIRLKAEDYLKMPRIIYNNIELILPNKLKKQYEELEREFFLKLEEVEIEVFSQVAISMKLRQFLQGGLYYDDKQNWIKVHDHKIQRLKEFMETTPAPVLLPIQFRFELVMIKKLWPDTAVIAGGIKQHDAVSIIERWNRGQIPLLVCHPASVARGLNLQAGSHIILWHALTWSADHYEQLNGRLYRQGQKHPVIINHLIFKDTIDEVVARALENKITTQRELLEALKDYGKSRS